MVWSVLSRESAHRNLLSVSDLAPDYARVFDVMKQVEIEGLSEHETLERVMEAARG